ncbi:MAG: DUF1552 domain-containing protein [Archangium sp.]|nr:DUF1552 domain-containing protein [Archangium sp.]MDP3573303.1 DUF1552 domain-containing protein [Archangium sp.]
MKLSRRQILRGAGGIVVGLPFLEALAPHKAFAQSMPQKRFIGIYHPNGVYTPQWFPTGDENNFTLGPIHQSLAPWKSKLLFTSGVDMQVAVSGPGEQHQRGIGAFLTGAKLDTGTFVGNDGSRAGYALGPSVDQTIAGMIGQGTRVPSLQLGVHALLSNVAGVVSYRGPNQPLLAQNDPRVTFRTLFMDSGMPPTEMEKLRVRRRSVLDAVQTQLAALKKSVSKSDQARLDQHLTLVREMENRLTALPPGTCQSPTDPGMVDFEREAEIPTVARLQMDLLTLALRCDLTRVATVMFSDAMNHVAMPHLNITSDIHNLTHYGDGDPERLKVATRDTWQAGVLATLLQELDSIQEMDGSKALDHTLVFWGSDVSRGNVHSHDDMPFMLAGGGAGFRMGRFVKWTNAYHNDLLVSIINGYGGNLTTYGEAAFCRGPLTNLT